jgi:hypothetical protein
MRFRTLLVAALCAASALTAGPAEAASGRALIFATNNTAIIIDPADPRLRTHLVRFDHEVRAIVRAGGAHAGRSTLLDGVFWSGDLQQTTYERSREFDVTGVSAAGLHHIADVVRKTFDQESVLTFEFLPRTAPRADAVEIEAPGADVRRLHDALTTDPDARERLGGGSVTPAGHLILVAARTDLALARRVVTESGATWSAATVRYGAEEFVG